VPPLNTSGRAFYTGLLEALLSVMGSSKGYLLDHGPRTAYLARQLAAAAGCTSREIAEVTLAGVLSDVGMIGLAEDAWENPVPVLDPRTRGLVRAHPIRSEATLGGIPHFERIAELARSHHEWWNGNGYPDELSGEAIPLGARVLRIADTVTALGEARPQRPQRTPSEIRAIVRDSAGREFDPGLADLWLELDAQGRLSDYSSAIYDLWSWEATNTVVPESVTPLSVTQLLQILASVIDAKDPYTAGHSRRVATIAFRLAGDLGLPEETCRTIWSSGFLHDIGKLAVPLRVLTKPGNLSKREAEAIRSHTTLGANVLGEIEPLAHLRVGARYHHERWDGTGYPEGLRGGQIPLIPRILAVADAYDAMTSGRAYRGRVTHVEARAEIIDNAGRHFCPSAADAFARLPTSFFDSVRHDGGEVAAARVPWPAHLERRATPTLPPGSEAD
jgi:HD-GYP domain-containing protein (c-di-GMP phosphodiesterase class II)